MKRDTGRHCTLHNGAITKCAIRATGGPVSHQSQHGGGTQMTNAVDAQEMGIWQRIDAWWIALPRSDKLAWVLCLSYAIVHLAVVGVWDRVFGKRIKKQESN